jgi:hypothetical protein
MCRIGSTGLPSHGVAGIGSPSCNKPSGRHKKKKETGEGITFRQREEVRRMFGSLSTLIVPIESRESYPGKPVSREGECRVMDPLLIVAKHTLHKEVRMSVYTKRQRIAKIAKQHLEEPITLLHNYIDEEWLTASCGSYALPLIEGKESLRITSQLVEELWNLKDQKGMLPPYMEKSIFCIPGIPEMKSMVTLKAA